MAGVTAIDTSVAEVTVKPAVPETLPLVAVTVVVPAASALARPCEPAALLMVAAAVLDEPHVKVVVMFWVELSENVPMAVNCCVVPMAALLPAGVTAIDVKVAAVTVNCVAVALILPWLATILDVPATSAVAQPREPDILLIVVTAGVAEAQVTELVRSCVEPSVNVPVATNCWVIPAATLGFAGVIASDLSVALVTVSGALAEVIAPRVAVMLAVPTATAEAPPLVPAALLTVAVPSASDAQVTDVVKSWVELSVNIPVAVNCWVVPAAITLLDGVTAMETSVALVTASAKVALLPR